MILKTNELHQWNVTVLYLVCKAAVLETSLNSGNTFTTVCDLPPNILLPSKKMYELLSVTKSERWYRTDPGSNITRQCIPLAAD